MGGIGKNCNQENKEIQHSREIYCKRLCQVIIIVKYQIHCV